MSAPDAALSSALVRDLERRLRAAQRDWRSPAVSAGVVRDGTLVWSGHVGAARVDGAVPPGDDTQYMIGSITKTFTAVLVMALRDEGRLALDDRLDTYLPGTRHGAVTIRQMLAHASGLQREPVGRIWENLEAPDQERLLRELEDAERVLPPHFVFHYSNLAYALLGQIVERVEKRSWEETVTERILNPLEMRHTGLTPDEDARALGYLVHPHAGTVTVEPRFDLRATSALGGLWSTVADLGRYASFVADPVAEVLAPSTLEEMCEPQVVMDRERWTAAMGLGFFLARSGTRTYVGHTGGMPGHITAVFTDRSAKTGGIVLTNAGTTPDIAGFATTLADLVTEHDPVDPEPWRPGTAVPPELADLVGVWYSEGVPFTFTVLKGALEARADGLPEHKPSSRFEQVGPDLFRTVAGRENGELLRVTRDADGRVTKMNWATYLVTREPLAFGEWL